MAAQRKLQGEIEKNLKKVEEGRDIFNDLWNKVHECDHGNQREKLEGDLKKEIKKLQRLREQIKAWIASGDIKDKQPLMDARKAIERDMERFKVCEKESKAKSFGGAGGNVSKLDPKELAKENARDWINNTVETFQSKIEEYQYEIEELQANVKKKQKPPARLTELEVIVGTQKDHVIRLEKVLRCLDNDTIAPEEVFDLQADMENYLNGEQSEEGCSDIDDMYEPLADRLEAVDNATPAGLNASAAKHQRKDEDERKEREKERAAAVAAKAQLIAQGNTNVRLMDDDGERGKLLPTAARGSLTAPPGTVPAPPPATSTSGTFSPASLTPRAGQAGASHTSAFNMPSVSSAPVPGETSTLNDLAAPLVPPPAAPPRAMPSPSPPAADPPAIAPLTTSVSVGAVPQGINRGLPGVWSGAGVPVHDNVPSIAQLTSASSFHEDVRPPNSTWASTSSAPSATSSNPAAPPAMVKPTPAPPPGMAPPNSIPPAKQPPNAPPHIGNQNAAAAVASVGKLAPSTVPPQPSSAPQPRSGFAVGKSHESQPDFVDGSIRDDRVAGPSAETRQLSVEAEQSANPSAVTASTFGDLPVSELSLPSVSIPYSTTAARHILEACFNRASPTAADMDWKRYSPRYATVTPASYPKYPAEVVDNPVLFRKMDPECLFYAFYYQPDTRQQYLAAQELKRQSWRFHKQHNAWFQRYTEPTVTSDEFEQGTYVYFDYNIMHDDMQSGWCYRRKENFTFKYDALEDELPASTS